ncbi:response regulator transcription factor [Metallumcola ferriviriculae]|uniref:Stage 0 sporulation protein A homolog n=1 Tax=Metallumcola ferriviriculae TaxID=3039180 RepID=A0AAU0URF1_9FIRM|nr:response regulator transcription factor [Desulfitibacteraceae bacterium MK1]
MDKIKIVIVDDHEMVRVGLGHILRGESMFELVGQADTPDKGVEAVKSACPDVVLMDVRFPSGNGIEACREIKSACPELKVLMLTSYSDDDAIMSSIMAGANGYLLKQIAGDELIESIKKVAQGQSLLAPEITGKVMDLVKSYPKERVDVETNILTPKEKHILLLIAKGKTNNEIAQELYLSPKTIKNYVSIILSKLGLSNRANAAAYAVEHRFDLKKY